MKNISCVIQKFLEFKFEIKLQLFLLLSENQHHNLMIHVYSSKNKFCSTWKKDTIPTISDLKFRIWGISSNGKTNSIYTV